MLGSENFARWRTGHEGSSMSGCECELAWVQEDASVSTRGCKKLQVWEGVSITGGILVSVCYCTTFCVFLFLHPCVLLPTFGHSFLASLCSCAHIWVFLHSLLCALVYIISKVIVSPPPFDMTKEGTACIPMEWMTCFTYFNSCSILRTINQSKWQKHDIDVVCVSTNQQTKGRNQTSCKHGYAVAPPVDDQCCNWTCRKKSSIIYPPYSHSLNWVCAVYGPGWLQIRKLNFIDLFCHIFAEIRIYLLKALCTCLAFVYQFKFLLHKRSLCLPIPQSIP